MLMAIVATLPDEGDQEQTAADWEGRDGPL